MNNAEFLKALLATDKSSVVTTLVEDYCEAHSAAIRWRPVGDKPNNSGPIGVAGDPARALLERVTNAIDAVIERAHQEHQGKPKCSSPREAVQTWFGIPSQGLHKLADAAARKLAQEAVTVVLHEGEGPNKRTVDVIDYGSGLTQAQMPTTILSLNAENKLDKFYLSGAFGQGGSATLSSSEVTLIASRSHKAPDTVAFTIVKFQPPAGLKLGSYVYLTIDGEVLSTDAVPKDFGSTVVRHFGYDLDAYKGALGPNSLYGRSQAILFDPVLPFWFDNRVNGYRRTIKGSRTALNGAREEGDPEAKLSHSCPIFFPDLGDYGQVGIEYWVLEPSSKSAPNKAFVSGTRPIVLTINGQTHAEWSSLILRKDAGLMHLASRMVVHLDCNRLSPDAKRVLFVSNREESRRNTVQALLQQELLRVFAADDRLKELEEQARHAGHKERDEQAEKEIRREVAQMLKIFGFSVAEDAPAAAASGGESGGASGKPRPARPNPAPIEITEPPTFVELVGPSPITLYPGQRRYVRIRTDANSRYHDPQDLTASKFNFLLQGEGVTLAGTTALRDGHMRAVLAASTECTIGATGNLRVELYRTGMAPLAAQSPILIVKAPEISKGTEKIKLPRIDIQAVTSVESEEWVSLAWPEDVREVAFDYVYQKDSDTLVIRYSAIFPRFEGVFSNFAARDLPASVSFRTRYEMWLTAMTIIHWQDVEADATRVTDEDFDQDRMDNYRRDELRRFAKVAIIYAQRDVVNEKGAAVADDA